MDVKEAISLAKGYVQDIFSDENISNLGLEEVEFDDNDREWRITLGFTRPWGDFRDSLYGKQRSYKIVKVSDASRRVTSIKNREPQPQ
ncbi:MAG: hypothetical protein JO366_04220 [Methylobacteriaceae bacterium]|nr:hypothetical protein [Methylobacteriaceae bacterium]MBV9220178.1 hypothetical protein [Methylobacteriaceae bacterium]MBV9243998.1 hypothetical protein [Methylobacteriaceae bacterium]MBV9635427.1 hypothetical protein [Methylobacteriaceae bacterium]